MTRLRWVGAFLLIVHLGLLAYGLHDPDAMLRFDRTGKRITSVGLLLDSPSLELLLSRGPPGDYAWHAGVLGLSGRWLPAVQLVQLLLAAASLALVYRMVLWLEGRREVALLAAAFYAAIPIDFMIPHFLASEAFFNPLLLLGCAGLVRYALHSADAASLAGAGLAFGLAALTRTESLPWLLVMLGCAMLVARHVAPQRALAHVALLAVLTLAGVLAWLALAPTAPVDLGRASLSLDWELANRANRVIRSAGGDTSGIEAAPFAAFGRAAVDHPVAFAREWALQAGKLLALPDNLDAFRYLGLYEYTGQRAEWVHELGVVGALRAVFEEMPVLGSWLVASVVVWLGFACVALRGAWDAIRGSAGVERLVYVLLLSLPIVWAALRVLTQGDSRKRSPVDFALAIFAAIAVMRSRRAGSRPAVSTATRSIGS